MHLHANGKFAKEICDDLNNKGFKNKQGRKFTVEIIAKMLRNRKYIGEFNCKGIVYNDIVPPIILYNDRIIIIYNTKPNDCEEIIINGKEDIEKIETAIAKNAEKKSFSEFHAERPVDGGEDGIRTHVPKIGQLHFECSSL